MGRCLSAVLLAGHLVDYIAKVSLLACLAGAELWAQFFTLVVVHIIVNIHLACATLQGNKRLPRAVVPFAALVLGTATPLNQVLQCYEMVESLWFSGAGGLGRLRTKPLEWVIEGDAFVFTAMHLAVGRLIGDFEPPDALPSPVFETVLALALAVSLSTVAACLVLWDCAVSCRLSRDLYGLRSRTSQSSTAAAEAGEAGSAAWDPGTREPKAPAAIGGAFAAHLAFRASEVAGRAAQLALLAVLLRPIAAAGCLAASYASGFLLLYSASSRDARASCQQLGAVCMLAWPLLFTNLAQFVDSPRHLVATHRLTSLICCLRVAELAATSGAAVSVVILLAGTEAAGSSSPEDEAPAENDAQRVARALRVLHSRHVLLALGFCWLAHYALMASVCGAAPGAVGGTGSPPREQDEGPSTGSKAPVSPSPQEDEPGVALLLLAAACEHAPWPWSAEVELAAGADTYHGVLERQPTLQDFVTIRIIGRGEFGRVYQVRQRATQKVFAMKRLSKEFYFGRRMTEKATREIEMLRAAGGHPFVVGLAHTIETSREWVVVMEFCPQGDLQQLLLQEGAPGLVLERALRLSAEVALALEHLHGRGIVFRDLKLENVVLDRHGHAKLTDFGLAKQAEDGADAIAAAARAGGAYAAFTGTFCGSYGYAAPEVSLGRQAHGFAADMYSFGVLLFMLITGGEVYHNPNEHPHERRLPPETPRDLRAILGFLGFDFYWASQQLLRSAGTLYRLELDLNGKVVLARRGPPMARRVRPERPPSSPQEWPGGAAPGALLGPPKFPISASESSEVSGRRWELALDLVRGLTDESPDRRGTVASLKVHPFFAEGVHDWRMVYPRSWMMDVLKAQLLALSGSRGIPHSTEQWLQQMPMEVLVLLKDDPLAQAELLDRTSANTPTEESTGRWAGGHSSAVSSRASSGLSSPRLVPSRPRSSPARTRGRPSPPPLHARPTTAESVQSWCAHYWGGGSSA